MSVLDRIRRRSRDTGQRIATSTNQQQFDQQNAEAQALREQLAATRLHVLVVWAQNHDRGIHSDLLELLEPGVRFTHLTLSQVTSGAARGLSADVVVMSPTAGRHPSARRARDELTPVTLSSTVGWAKRDWVGELVSRAMGV